MYAIDIVIPRVSEKESERERGVESRQKRKTKMSCTSSILLWVGQSGGGRGYDGPGVGPDKSIRLWSDTLH